MHVFGACTLECTAHKLIFSILLYAFERESTALLFEFMAVQIQERAGEDSFLPFMYG